MADLPSPFPSTGTAIFFGTSSGGNDLQGNFQGDIFELAKTGAGAFKFKFIYGFTGGPDGRGAIRRPRDRFEWQPFRSFHGLPGGSVFELAPVPDGMYAFHSLHTFTGGDDGFTSSSSLSLDSGGNIFGFAAGASPSGEGSFYRLAKDASGGWSFSTVFRLAKNTLSPAGSVRADGSGKVFAVGKQFYLTNTLFQLSPEAGGYSLTAVLSGLSGLEGDNPVGQSISDSNGNIYIALKRGGAWGLGTILELVKTTAGYEPVVLHTFAGIAERDGAIPSSGLAADKAGNLYGTTMSGGDPTANAGTIFELEKGTNGYTYSLLYRFSGGSDGTWPVGVVTDSAGHLYGATAFGAVYEVAIGSGTSQLTLLHSFGNQIAAPALVRDSSGNLYGTYLATVYRVSNSGSFSTVRVFNGPGDSPPFGPLTLDSSGTLFGVTAEAVFRMSRSGDSFKNLRSFVSLDLKNGYLPAAPLVEDSAGLLVGSTTSGGEDDFSGGTIFRISQDGSQFSSLYSFSGSLDGAFPNGGLTFDSEGRIIGTTSLGGSGSAGTVFRLESSGPALVVSPGVLPAGKMFRKYSAVQLAGAGGQPP